MNASDIQPAAGDLVLTCRHLPDPWSERCVLYRVPEAWSFTGVTLGHEFIALGKPRTRRWLLVCSGCAHVLDTADRKHEAASDVVGASTIWRADLPPIRWANAVRETREIRELNVSGLWVPVQVRKVPS